MKTKKNILIIGGGAGGLELAASLGRKLGKKKLHITLVDKTLTHIWKPLLHEVAAGTLPYHNDELNYINHAAKNNYHFVLGTMTNLDRANKKITLSPIQTKDGDISINERQIEYDILVLAIGSQANTFNIPGADEHCFYLDSLNEAKNFHRHLIDRIIQMRQYEHQKEKIPLSIAIIGGGATGVELAAELAFSIIEAKKVGLGPADDVSTPIHIIEASDRVLPLLPERIGLSVMKELSKRDITIHANEMVSQIDKKSIHTKSGLKINATLKIWVAGVKVDSWTNACDGLQTNSINQFLVKPTLQTTVDDDIFAIGDCAGLKQNESWLPARAQTASQQAVFLKKNIINQIKNKPLLNFKYVDYGSLINLSHQKTFALLMGKFSKKFLLEGKIARIMYLFLYKKHQAICYGWWFVIKNMLSSFIEKRIKPRLKLH